MLLSTMTGDLAQTFSHKKAIKIIKEAGFDAFDLTLCDMFINAKKPFNENCPFNSDDYLDYAKDLRKYADKIGIICNQAHAPFGSSCGIPETDEIIFKQIVRSMEIASIMGAKIIVVHPKQHLTYAENTEELFNLNVEFYKSLIPYCEKYNIKVATENMWQYNNNSKSIIDSTCSRAWEFCKYIDTIDSEWIVGCLDIGHVSLIGADIPEFIKTMGNKRLQALHVHDTDFIHDSHTIPFLEKIDFTAVSKALGEIDYQGDFTFEVQAIFRKYPKELLPSVAKFLCDVGRYLIEQTK
ncbi:MAG: sugar phosphate isomerase/epimerase [Ruminococcaceae bacterium]|nr:sugar phosphate isomerase/epimerase [Oscillospiraceae bacterium]